MFNKPDRLPIFPKISSSQEYSVVGDIRGNFSQSRGRKKRESGDLEKGEECEVEIQPLGQYGIKYKGGSNVILLSLTE